MMWLVRSYFTLWLSGRHCLFDTYTVSVYGVCLRFSILTISGQMCVTDPKKGGLTYQQAPLAQHLWYIYDGSVQDCSNSTANTLELLQSLTKPSIIPNDLWYLMMPWKLSDHDGKDNSVFSVPHPCGLSVSWRLRIRAAISLPMVAD